MTLSATSEPEAKPTHAIAAIERSKLQGGAVVTIYRFGQADEEYLFSRAIESDQDLDTPGRDVDRTIHRGDGWAVELIGDGDPR